jgi:hypothetical protein
MILVPGWTRAHGFFLIMGGFQLFKRPDHPPRPVDQEKDDITTDLGSFVRILDIHDAHQHGLGKIIPLTSRAEIKDRGKSDGISKFIVLLQTSWFIIQCIARGIEHLPLTELEIVTLAYAMMNFFVYIFWWDKPRDVGCPVRVYEDLPTSHRANGWDGGVVEIFVKVYVYALGMQDDTVTLSQESRVPMFWSGGAENSDSVTSTSMRAALGPSILGIVFGAIHFIAWSYMFPSRAELALWRISCIAMIVIPLLLTFICAMATTTPEPKGLLRIIAGASMVLLVLSAWLYIASRIATIIIAFTTLRSLPSEAFTVVDWTTFIPHI